MRAGTSVRAAVEVDLPEVARLFAEQGHDGPAGAAFEPERLCQHLSVHLAAGGRVLVATQDDRVVGVLLARVLDPYLFARTPSLYVDGLLVTPGSRRQGVGRAMLAAALELATTHGVEEIYCAPAPGARDVHRFLARLGFAPAAGHRVVPAAVLERRLEQQPEPRPRVIRSREGRRRRDSTRAAIEELVARRRRAREAGLPTGPVDLRAIQARRDAAGPAVEGADTVTSSVS